MSRILGRLGQRECGWLPAVKVATWALTLWIAFGAGWIAREEAAPSTVDGPRSTVYHSPSMVYGSLSTVAAAADTRTENRHAVYGSSIKDTYHREGCRYLEMVEHLVRWNCREDAEAEGRRPCAACFWSGAE